MEENVPGENYIAPARRAGDPGSNPGLGKNFSLKLLIYIIIYNLNRKGLIYSN